MSDFVGNPEDRFSHDTAHMQKPGFLMKRLVSYWTRNRFYNALLNYDYIRNMLPVNLRKLISKKAYDLLLNFRITLKAVHKGGK